MAKGLNEIKIIGNLGGEPEVKNLEGGNKVVSFSVATSETFTRKGTNEKVVNTEWHRVVSWNKLAEIIEKYVKKGDKIYVTGKMTYREYENAEGNKVRISEIVASDIILLSGYAAPVQQNPNPAENFKEEEHDDLPF